jgi:hypothetical protein
LGRSSLDECSPEERDYALETLALFAAMEISALDILLRDLGEMEPKLYLAGSPAPLIEGRVSKLLGRAVGSLGRCASAKGCALVAQDVFFGAEQILGIDVDERARHREG